MNKAKSLSKITITPQSTVQSQSQQSKVNHQAMHTLKSSSFITNCAVSNGSSSKFSQQFKQQQSKSPSMTSSFQNTSRLSSTRRLSMKVPDTNTMHEHKNILQQISDLDKCTDIVSKRNGQFSNTRKRSLNYNSNPSVKQETARVSINGSVYKQNGATSTQPKTQSMGKRKYSANILKKDFTEKSTPQLKQQAKGQHKRIISQQQPQSRKRNMNDYLSESLIHSTMNSQKMSFRSVHPESIEKEFDPQLTQNYLSNQTSERRTSSNTLKYRSNSSAGGEYYSSQQQMNRKVLNEHAMQEEIAKIHLRQKEKADELIEQFNKLKRQAKDALDAQFSTLNSSQPINVDQYVMRMDKFEKIIENLVDRQKQTQDELEGAKVMLGTRSSQGIDFAQTQNHLNKTTFGNLSLESSYKSISSKHLCKNHISQLGNTLQVVKDMNNCICSSSSTLDKRDKFNTPFVLDQSLPKKANGIISSIKQGSASTVKNYENISPDKKLLINAFTLNAQKNQQTQFKSFLDTLQNLEEYKQSKPQLHAIREKLNSYKDQLKSCNKTVTKNEYNSKILSLLENIIIKMDNQLVNQVPLHLDEENVMDSSVDKSKILCDTTNQSPINALANISSVPNLSNNYIMVNTNYQPPTTNCDVSGIIDTSMHSCISARRQRLQKTCNRSGFQVKHSRDGKANQYQVENLIIMETHEEFEDTLGWQQEIKHIKTLLGAMAVDFDSKHTGTSNSHHYKDNQQCRIL